MAVFFDVHGGGEEESSAHHGDEGAEQHRELQRAKLPEERVRLPQRVRNLKRTESSLTYRTRVQYSSTVCARHTTPIRYGLPASPSRCEMTICRASAVARRVGTTTYCRQKRFQHLPLMKLAARICLPAEATAIGLSPLQPQRGVTS